MRLEVSKTVVRQERGSEGGTRHAAKGQRLGPGTLAPTSHTATVASVHEAAAQPSQLFSMLFKTEHPANRVCVCVCFSVSQ